MSRVIYIGLVSLLMSASAAARAEGGCPPGQVPYTGTPAEGSAASIASCGPIPSNRRAVSPQWETRWGSIASGGEYGIVTGLKSERQARKNAIAECQKRGGTTCKELLTFRDQCAAVVVSTSQSFAQAAASEEDAIGTGKKRCAASNTGDCWVYYSGCSLPVRAN